jgi:arylsulfatase A-like enzyme
MSMWDRRRLAIALFLLVAAGGTAPGPRPSAVLIGDRFGALGARVEAAQPLNVVQILTDDLDVNTLNDALAAGLLPAIRQRLVEEGVVFDNSFVPLPQCCPDRATLLTGQYAHNSNVKGNGPPPGAIVNLNDRLVLPCWLQPAGYRSVHIGKYLNGYGSGGESANPATPLHPLYVPPCWDAIWGWQGFVDLSTYTAYDYIVNDTGVLTDHRQFGRADWNYQTDMIALRMEYWMTDAVQRPQPFFVSVAPASPHFQFTNRDDHAIVNVCPGPPDNAPFNGGGNLWGISLEAAPRHQGTVALALPYGPAFNESDATIGSKPVWVRSRALLTGNDVTCVERQHQRRVEALRAVDDLVARLFAFLDSHDLTGRTVVIFTSDNGYLRGEHRLTEKGAPYEEAIRVPLVMRGPWPAHHVAQMVNAADIAPTIAAVAGAVPNNAPDGRSLVPLLQAANPASIPWRNVMEIESYEGSVDGSPANWGAYPVINSPFIGVRVMKPPRMYLRFTATGERELYDLAADPSELHNLAGDPARAKEVELFDAIAVALQGCKNVGCQFLEVLFKFK